ncbi:2'-5' RNA ligase family protein [Paludibacterium purpuratum]|uniref:2'-5' RNA ligase n=1 Tax=Paludibacterium purpuratum TaxID=1144873 RepID=A0A4R7B9X1_9NEIS|nr:2'-5' RNA ligase family protein [Paludibacterium purpuratum]TDR80635.1 2'-5' RNA ligase [Paludibacterium purpuratum]
MAARLLQPELQAASHTLAHEHGDFTDWHRGRPWFWLWAIDADEADVAARMAAACRHLEGTLLPGYCREPHITLSLCGFPGGDGDYAPVRLSTQLRALRRLAPTPFVLQIGALDSFLSAPFLQVHDAGRQLAAVRGCLVGYPLDHPPEDYVPHITVGLYGGRWPTGSLAERLLEFPAGGRLNLPVERLSLMRYASADIGGQLETMADYRLASGELIWRPAFKAQLAPRWL